MEKKIKYIGIGVILVIVIIVSLFFGVKIPTIYDIPEFSSIINPIDLLLIVLIIYSLTSTVLFIILLKKNIDSVKLIENLMKEDH